ncbi:hypothetical protein [Xenorhabdus sp. SGI240]|uniref:hypothetical protein n=1 Tax=Xenorhabdus sp. SGI240 TaxID=3158262 RepID=UPI0032B7485A
MNIAAFNAGVVLGSIMGGTTVRGWGLDTLTWVGAGVSILAIISLVWQMVIPSMREKRSISHSP